MFSSMGNQLTKLQLFALQKCIASENTACPLFVDIATVQLSSLFLKSGDNIKTESRLYEK